MNLGVRRGLWSKIRSELALATRVFEPVRCEAFDRDGIDSIGRIHVINLDRRADRWNRMRRELDRLRGRSGNRLTTMVRRFAAIDARDLEPGDVTDVVSTYSMAEQLYVQPESALEDRSDLDDVTITMSRQEIAVAMSHIALWRQVASVDTPYTLILEDDVWFGPRFASRFARAWADLPRSAVGVPTFDLLYVSYKAARPMRAEGSATGALTFAPGPGLWQMSGYVVSRSGAQQLLDLLPVRGPIDMWINHQFHALAVRATRSPLVWQRTDQGSSNVYSVLPVLSSMGSIVEDKPLLPAERRMPLVFAGGASTGASALAMALSMLGFRCLSDLVSLPIDEQARLDCGRSLSFDAYVNVGALGPDRWSEIARRYGHARFVQLVDGASSAGPSVSADVHGRRLLFLPVEHPDKWQLLADFFCIDYPTHQYPNVPDAYPRHLSIEPSDKSTGPTRIRALKADRTPWILDHAGWDGLLVASQRPVTEATATAALPCASVEFRRDWVRRDDTFPSNLAVFRPDHVVLDEAGAELVLDECPSSARLFAAGALATTRQYLYGTFAAEIRPSCEPGTVTGMFLHRNGPRQEIDIEFVGRDTTIMLANVYYNPGVDGTRLEYGYRGCPVEIDLGFDAAEELHRYELRWWPDVIEWCVDGRVVHRRRPWQPTPVPAMPMEFNINLWPTRSRELAGRIATADLPARARIEAVRLVGT